MWLCVSHAENSGIHLAVIAGLSGLESCYTIGGRCVGSRWLDRFVDLFQAKVVKPPLAVVFQGTVVQPTQFSTGIHYRSPVSFSMRSYYAPGTK